MTQKTVKEAIERFKLLHPEYGTKAGAARKGLQASRQFLELFGLKTVDELADNMAGPYGRNLPTVCAGEKAAGMQDHYYVRTVGLCIDFTVAQWTEGTDLSFPLVWKHD